MIPTRIGQQTPGGYFVGINRIKNNCYAVVVSPKCVETVLASKTTCTATPNTQSVNDGLANTLAMDSNEHPAAQYCLSVVVDKCNDYYLPSKCELELCYRNLKPSNSENFIGSDNYVFNQLSHLPGANLHAVPTGNPYTLTDPTQTIVTKFVTKNAEAFNTDTYYWSSTESRMYTTLSGYQHFSDSSQLENIKTNIADVRAVCRICIV